MFIIGKNEAKYVKIIFLGTAGLCFIAGGQVFASSHILNDSHVSLPNRIIVAQSFEEQREQNRRKFEERREQNKREFEERREQSRKEFEKQKEQDRREFEEQRKKGEEQFDQSVKESHKSFDNFTTIVIVFAAVSLVVKLLGIYVASKRK